MICHALGGVGHRCVGDVREVLIGYTAKGDYAGLAGPIDHVDYYHYCQKAIDTARAQGAGVKITDHRGSAPTMNRGSVPKRKK